MRRKHFYNVNNDYIIKLMESSNIITDDRTNQPIELTGLVEFENPQKPLAACINNEFYSLNEVYLLRESGKFVLHLSQLPIGGYLDEAYPDRKSIQDYNSKYISPSGIIRCIHRPNGTKIWRED